uniref:Coronatine-insensitive protein 1 n=1 Tax=Arundo donax TaxID=35708 RepID=A0A0A9HN17_ARUDO
MYSSSRQPTAIAVKPT